MVELADLLLNLLVNLVGVFVGVTLALFIDRTEKRKTENKERRKISDSLTAELEANLERIESGNKITLYDLAGVKREILLTRFNTATLESVVNSGKMTLLESSIQASLSDIHQLISLIEMTTNRIFDFMTSMERTMKKNEVKKILDWLSENLEIQYKGLGDIIPETLEELRKGKK